MGVKERRQRQKQGVREKILDAARDLFVQNGYDAVTMRQIADKIEYTPTAIYFHFKDKQELINELCAIDFLKLAREFNALAEIADPRERLIRLAHAYMAYGLKYPNHYRIMFMSTHPHAGPQENRLIKFGNPSEDAYAFLRSTVIECIAAGVFSKKYRDPELLAQALWAAVHGVTALHIARKNDPWVPWRSAEETAKVLLGPLLRGLGPEPGEDAGKNNTSDVRTGRKTKKSHG
jgi:AcrR family transcriptional regulator